jgi:CBS domain-containing protein/gamma-glutamylcysteine synthetase
MGEQKVSSVDKKATLHRFVRSLLNDVMAMEHMLEHEWFEDDVVRIGAEQEMILVDRKTFKLAPIAMEVMEAVSDYPWIETELARFNLEINLDPHVFAENCLRKMEDEVLTKTRIIRDVLHPMGADLILTGILPTIRKYDLELHNLTPRDRYKVLMDAIHKQLLGSAFELRLSGIDELLVKHNSPLLEACNTSFQVHLQVRPQEFVGMYNIAQALAAPVMAVAANSPLVFGRRLWHESRIALFQQALDVRTTHDHMRERSPRVSFGTQWLDQSIMEIYKEDIARFRVLLSTNTEEDALQMIKKEQVPKLKALQVHNSTVYRWNRPCYGISDTGKPHLRIENRILPAGPTVLDEVSNAALWLGAMVGMYQKEGVISGKMNWEDARDNFGKAARTGLDSKFIWLNDKNISATDLLLEEIIPLAREGLKTQDINPEDIDRYLGVIEERTKKHTNGARWQIKAFSKLKKQTSDDEALSVLTCSIMQNQAREKPIHDWSMPKLSDLPEYRPSALKVDEFMETDLFTVQKDDPISLVAQLMDWRKIRYMPVEDSKGNLSGLITSRLLLRYFARSNSLNGRKSRNVADIMINEPITATPNTTIIEALQLMRSNKIGCLPVVIENELVGIITEMDFLRISSRLIERLEK